MAVSSRNSSAMVRTYYVLPCCLLLLNLGVELLSYKARLIASPLARTGFILFMAACGASLVGKVVSPGIEGFVRRLHRTSRRGAGRMGEWLFLASLGALIFWLYYLVYILGPEAVLPGAWENR